MLTLPPFMVPEFAIPAHDCCQHVAEGHPRSALRTQALRFDLPLVHRNLVVGQTVVPAQFEELAVIEAFFATALLINERCQGIAAAVLIFTGILGRDD